MPDKLPTRDDPFDLQRFIDAQAPVYEQVCTELAAGDKRSHWMWFVFPQLAALGRSTTAIHFGIRSQAEAAAYLAHPKLGERLRHCTSLVLGVQGRSAHQIFHSPDDLKFRSCMTLFGAVAPDEPLFAQGLARYFDGQADPLTQQWLAAQA
ncbi:DUF1810 domain-containing protein [Variovorax dokdonensis]|uniref:DUF1810 domain-containing protein n=1 Tax=Variovorax dokdonensis TaxID=344883 RepID=A0ABT7NCN9_9BURK|nr:DUF1810 domain-containing protein [Variovorax dokdonensis]MDM0045693.1 DUF1810 domain-containing protein [Variovorax dokdonensis]